MLQVRLRLKIQRLRRRSSRPQRLLKFKHSTLHQQRQQRLARKQAQQPVAEQEARRLLALVLAERTHWVTFPQALTGTPVITTPGASFSRP